MRRLAKDNEEITLSVRMNGNQNYNKDHTCVDDEDDMILIVTLHARAIKSYTTVNTNLCLIIN